MRMTIDEIKAFLRNADIDCLKILESLTKKELDTRNKEVYKEYINNVLTAINDLIDNGFGHFTAFPQDEYVDWTWEDLRAELKDHFLTIT